MFQSNWANENLQTKIRDFMKIVNVGVFFCKTIFTQISVNLKWNYKKILLKCKPKEMEKWMKFERNKSQYKCEKNNQQKRNNKHSLI